MLVAILKHEEGPHFVKVVGPAKSVEHWKDSVRAYLKSVKENDKTAEKEGKRRPKDEQEGVRP